MVGWGGGMVGLGRGVVRGTGRRRRGEGGGRETPVCTFDKPRLHRRSSARGSQGVMAIRFLLCVGGGAGISRLP